MVQSEDLSETWTMWSENWTEFGSRKGAGAKKNRKEESDFSLRFPLHLACKYLVLFSAAVARAGGFGFLLLAQHSLPRELDLVAFATDALHENLLPFFQFVTNVFNTTIRDLRDVQQSVRSRKDLHERSKVNNTVNRAEVSLAHFGFGS